MEDRDVREAIAKAEELVRDKDGYRFGRINNKGYFEGEVERNLNLEIYVGHNIYTTGIYLTRMDGLSPAYFYNGKFWLQRNGCAVELI